MESCGNCFNPIEDMRKETRCSTCNAPLHKDCAINDGGTFCDVCYTVKSEEKPKLEFELPLFIRRSFIETYRQCPTKFYYEAIKGMVSPPNIYTQLGIDLHILFDKANQDKWYSIHDMRHDFQQFWNGYKPELFGDVDNNKMYQRGLDSIDTYFEVTKDMSPMYKSEETIQFSIGEDLPLVQTTSDRINLIDGELEMKDWKTGKVMVGEKLSTDLQAPLYIYGAQEHYKIPVRKFTFHYLNENKTRVFERVSPDVYECQVLNRKYIINLTDAIKETQQIFSHIKKGEFNIPRNTKGMYYTCKYCHLQAQGVCKGADIESWRQYNK